MQFNGESNVHRKKMWIHFNSCNLNRLDFDFGHKVL